MSSANIGVKRRSFMTLLGGAAAAWPLAARAQQGERMRRIGALLNVGSDDPMGQARVAAFVHGLQAEGWSDGGNVQIDTPLGGRRSRQLPQVRGGTDRARTRRRPG